MDEWQHYQKLVLSELKRLSESIDSLSKAVTNNDKEITSLKAYSSFWGSLSGMITAIIAFIIDYFIRKT